MVYICIRCKKEFRSNYHLERHNNKQVPCGIILKCNQCNKVFPNSREINRHKQRKTPCKVIDRKSELELKLAIEKEKTERLKIEKNLEKKAKMDIIKLKNKKEVEVIKLKKEKDLENIREKIELEKAKELEIIEKKKEKELAQKDKQKELEADRGNIAIKLIQEKAELQLSRSQAIEKLKTERKEKTSQIININNTVNNINSIIQYITNEYSDEYKPTIEEAEDYNEDLHISNSYDNGKFYKRIYIENNSDCYDILVAFIRRYWANPDHDLYQCLFYNKSIDEFVGHCIKDTGKEFRVVDFDKELLTQTLKLFNQDRLKLIKVIQSSIDIFDPNYTEKKEKLIDFEIQSRILLNNTDVKDCFAKVLLIDDPVA